MANRPQQLTLPPLRAYSRTEFTALRARERPASRDDRAAYFDRDADDRVDVAQLLRTMRDDLVEAALRDGSLVPAGGDRQIRRAAPHARVPAADRAGGGAVGGRRAGGRAPVGRWFRSIVAVRLAGEGIRTPGELVALVNRRGGQWWRSVPRIDAGRTRVLVAWLRRHAASIGAVVEPNVDAGDALAPTTTRITTGAGQLTPLERLALADALSGAHGANRAPVFAYLGAAHDLDAVRAYLHHYDDRPATRRAYARELARLVLRCVAERGVALSSMRGQDCEA
nr:phage integrase family protein [Burkholderia ubonensis]